MGTAEKPSWRQALWRALTARRELHIPSVHAVLHKGEDFAHMTYLGMAAIETKYWYGKVAGLMLIIIVVKLFIREEHASSETLPAETGQTPE